MGDERLAEHEADNDDDTSELQVRRAEFAVNIALSEAIESHIGSEAHTSNLRKSPVYFYRSDPESQRDMVLDGQHQVSPVAPYGVQFYLANGGTVADLDRTPAW
jgi:hypothetical protein